MAEEMEVTGIIQEEEVIDEVETEEIESEESELSENWRDGLTADKIAEIERLLAKTSYYAHPLALASKKERKRMEGKTLITEDGSVRTTEDAAKQDRIELNASANGKRVLKGIVVGVKAAGESTASTNLAIVQYGNKTTKVYIPDYLLFDFDVRAIRDPNIQKKNADKITRMIGTEISFIVKHFDQKTNTAYADRLKALEQEAYNNYIRHMARNDKPRVKVGDIVQGRVTAVGKKYVRVCALGSESNIFQDSSMNILEASWHYVFDLRTMYKPNDIVACKVLSVNVRKTKKYDEEYTLVDTELSIKQTEENPQVKYFDNYREGEVCRCTITAVDDSLAQVYGIIDVDGQVDCMISYPTYGDLPKVGDNRVVRIVTMMRETDTGAKLEKNGSPVRRIYCHFADQH